MMLIFAETLKLHKFANGKSTWVEGSKMHMYELGYELVGSINYTS